MMAKVTPHERQYLTTNMRIITGPLTWQVYGDADVSGKDFGVNISAFYIPGQNSRCFLISSRNNPAKLGTGCGSLDV